MSPSCWIPFKELLRDPSPVMPLWIHHWNKILPKKWSTWQHWPQIKSNVVTRGDMKFSLCWARKTLCSKPMTPQELVRLIDPIGLRVSWTWDVEGKVRGIQVNWPPYHYQPFRIIQIILMSLSAQLHHGKGYHIVLYGLFWLLAVKRRYWHTEKEQIL